MLNYILYRIGEFIALHLPLKAAYTIAVLISDTRCLFARQDRRAVTENLKAIFPQKSDSQIRRLRRGVFRNFAKYLVDFFRFSKLSPEYIKINIKTQNTCYFDQVLQEGKGGIVLTAHLGNWELGGAVIAMLNYPFWAVALSHKHRKVNNFFTCRREDKGVRVIPLEKAVRSCLNLLKENKLVALLGDRVFGESGLVVDFFGRPTIFPIGPAAFSLKTQAPIIPGFMVRNQDDSFTLFMEKPLEFVPTGDKTKDLRALVNRYKCIIEEYVRKYPDQWYMFRKYWI